MNASALRSCTGRLLSIAECCQQASGEIGALLAPVAGGQPGSAANASGEVGVLLTPVTGGRTTSSKVDLGVIQVEVDGGGNTTGRVRFKKRPGEVCRPVGLWPGHWGDFTHESEGHSLDAKGHNDNDGEAILDRELMTFYVQHGVEMAYDDVSGAILNPHLVRGQGDRD